MLPVQTKTMLVMPVIVNRNCKALRNEVNDPGDFQADQNRAGLCRLKNSADSLLDYRVEWNQLHVDRASHLSADASSCDPAAEQAFVLGLIRQPQDAEDIVQEVWIRYSRALHSGKSIDHVPSWCRGVARATSRLPR